MDKLEGRKQELFALGGAIDAGLMVFIGTETCILESQIGKLNDSDWNALLEDVKTEYEKYLTSKKDG